MGDSVKPRKKYKYRGLSRGVIALMLICLTDMLSTLYFATRWNAEEWNPVMKWALEDGLWTFTWVKLGTFLPAVVICEWYRRYNPVLVRILVRSAIVAYLGIYVILIRLANAG